MNPPSLELHEAGGSWTPRPPLRSITYVSGYRFANRERQVTVEQTIAADTNCQVSRHRGSLASTRRTRSRATTSTSPADKSPVSHE